MKLEINCLPNLQTRNDSRVRLMLACVDNDDDDENYFHNSVNYHDNDRIRNTDQLQYCSNTTFLGAQFGILNSPMK